MSALPIRPFCFDMRFCLSILFLLLTEILIGQTPFYHSFSDSLLPNYRITHSIDSVDYYLADYQTTLPKQQAYRDLFFDLESPKNKNLLFSAIPQVGFHYSLGSKLSQTAGIHYRQLLDTGVYAQFIYTRKSSNGFLRSSAFEQNNLDAQFIIQKKRYVNWTKFFFIGNNADLNWGLKGDTLSSVDFGFDFQNVERTTASTSSRYFKASSENYFSFSQNEQKIGVFYIPELEISNKRYEETAIDLLNYSQINFDSSNTNDYWEKSSLTNKAGLFFEGKKLFARLGAILTYWDYDNLITHLDTTEFTLQLNAEYRFLNSVIRTNLESTLIGAKGEKNFQVSFLQPIKKINFKANVSFTEKYPLLNQRQYIGNGLNYSWTNKELIQKIGIDLLLNSTETKIPFSLLVSHKQIKNQAYFLTNQFRQDTFESVSQTKIELRSEFKYKKFFFQPLLKYSNFSSVFVSSYSTFARFGFEGTLLKSKKLKTVIGVELGYQSEQELVDYSGFVDEYTPIQTTERMNATAKLHVFNSYDLGFLRWNIRFENIEQLFKQSQNFTALGYPFAPFQFRFGVSWDLFN